jgi:hypothetical protein
MIATLHLILLLLIKKLNKLIRNITEQFLDKMCFYRKYTVRYFNNEYLPHEFVHDVVLIKKNHSCVCSNHQYLKTVLQNTFFK